MSNDFLFTSESVFEDHPDKAADQISDVILDAILAQDKYVHTAAETPCNTGLVVLTDEITTTANVDYIHVARETIKRVGYDSTEYGVDYKGCIVLVAYDKQSLDITQDVNRASDDYLNQGASDQGLMFGYACDKTPELMPFPIYYTHHLVECRSRLRRDGRLPWLHPDVKSRVAVRYVDGRPHGTDAVVLSTQHVSEMSQETIRETVIKKIIKPMLPLRVLAETKYLVNPTGHFVVGGPQDGCGLTGRKIIVGTYGGATPRGGGALSGKDPSKVDHSAAYATRYMAENVVVAGPARQCQVRVSCVISVAHLINITVYTEGTGVIPDEQIAKLMQKHFDLRPKGIIRMLDLLRPVCEKAATYGRSNREEPEFSWEATDKVLLLREAAGLAGGPAKAFA